MLGVPVLDKFVEGQPVTFGDRATERPWKDLIIRSVSDWQKEPIGQTTIILDFSLDISRLMMRGKQTKNDLDNLAKPVLDALVEANIIQSDSKVLDLVLRKRAEYKEGLRIRIFEWRELNLQF